MFKSEAMPKLTAYESILLVLSGLVKRGKIIINQHNLIEQLFKLSSEEGVGCVFDDIVFKNSYDSVSSIDIDDSLSKLQTYGAIGKLNPAYEKIVIYISLDDAEKFLSQYSNFSKNIDYICDKIQLS